MNTIQNNWWQRAFAGVLLLVSVSVTGASAQTQAIQAAIDTLYSDTLYTRDFSDSTKVDSYYLGKMQEAEAAIRANGLRILPENIASGKLFIVNATYDTGPGTTNYQTMVMQPFDKDGNLHPHLDTATSYALTAEAISTLQHIYGRPTNFHWGSCLTYVPYLVVLLYDDSQTLVCALTVGCGYSTSRIYPWDARLKFGGLAPRASRQLYDWVQRYAR